MMSVLFSKAKIGSLDLANRLIRTASHEGLADSRGRPTEDQFAFYKGFIKGGIGLVITGYAGISQTGKIPLPIITVGGMRSKILIENAIKSNQTDFVSIEKCGAGS
jgi:2,4-dienoyl-CoA reductase-like NADH-dependent reductase (Old Yellow Enzyme family)